MAVSGGTKGDKAGKTGGSGREVPHTYGGTGDQGIVPTPKIWPELSQTQPAGSHQSPVGTSQGHGPAARIKRELARLG